MSNRHLHEAFIYLMATVWPPLASIKEWTRLLGSGVLAKPVGQVAKSVLVRCMMSWWKAAVWVLAGGQAEEQMMEDEENWMMISWEGFFKLNSAVTKHADVGGGEHFAPTP